MPSLSVIFVPISMRQENSCYKHVHTHFDALYKCKICSKGFQYPTVLASHNLLHTRKLLIKCKVPGCKKKYVLHSALGKS